MASDTIGFNDAGNVVVVGGKEKSFISAFSSILPDEPNKDVATVLARYDRTGIYNFLSGGISSPFEISSLISNMGAYHKLDGYLGFTGTFSLKINWNSEPFTQGLYILGYVPPHCPLFPLKNGSDTTDFIATYLSGCHHVLINLAESTSVQLDIPYVGPSTFIPCGTARLPLLGRIYLVPIVPAESSQTLSELDYTAYFSIQDLKTYGNYPANVAVANPEISTFQSNIGKKEAISKGSTISKALGDVSEFIDKAGEYIPSALVPSSYVEGASFLFGGAAKIADLLGFSKPFSMKANERMTIVPYAETSTGDAVFSGAKLAMNCDAGLGALDLSGRGIDEMQISEMLSRFNYLPPYHKWDATTQSGTDVISLDIVPTDFKKVVAWGDPSTPGAYLNTQMSYVSRAFTKWRGSIRFRAVMVGTKFHSGRLRVVYYPRDSRAATPNSTQYIYAHVIDVRDPTTWDFEVPFIVDSPWIDVDQSSGQLHFIVDTPLVASSAAASHVNIALFVAAGSTFELAIPSKSRLKIPQYSYTPTKEVSTFQSGVTIDSIDNRRSVSVSLAPDSKSSSSTAHSLAIGDPVRSIRSIFKKFWVGTTPSWENAKVIIQQPFPVTPNPNSKDTDLIAYFANLFAFWRGGSRVYAQNYYPSRVSSVTIRSAFPNTTVNGQATSSAFDYTEANTTVMVGLVEPTAVELPYSYNTLCRNTFVPFDNQGESTQCVVIDYWLGASNAFVSRAMADDFTMGTLIGAPITLA